MTLASPNESAFVVTDRYPTTQGTTSDLRFVNQRCSPRGPEQLEGLVAGVSSRAFPVEDLLAAMPDVFDRSHWTCQSSRSTEGRASLRDNKNGHSLRYWCARRLGYIAECDLDLMLVLDAHVGGPLWDPCCCGEAGTALSPAHTRYSGRDAPHPVTYQNNQRPTASSRNWPADSPGLQFGRLFPPVLPPTTHFPPVFPQLSGPLWTHMDTTKGGRPTPKAQLKRCLLYTSPSPRD